MYNHLLDTFLIVAENNSFSKASQELFISIPAVKKQIDLLEKQLSIKLFNRNYKGVFLTEEGKIIYENVPDIKKLSNDILSKVKSNKVIINIGVFYMHDAKLILNKLNKKEDLIDKYKIKIVDIEKKIKNVDAIFNNEVDIVYGVYDTYITKNKYKFLKLNEVNPVIAIPRNNKLARKKKITVGDLKNENISIAKKGFSEYSDKLRKYIKANNKKIKINDYDMKDFELFSNQMPKNKLIFSSYYWGTINPNYEIAEFESNIKLNIGFIYKRNNNKKINSFIKDFKKIS